MSMRMAKKQHKVEKAEYIFISPDVVIRAVEPDPSQITTPFLKIEPSITKGNDNNGPASK